MCLYLHVAQTERQEAQQSGKSYTLYSSVPELATCMCVFPPENTTTPKLSVRQQAPTHTPIKTL